ncbi:MAG TPA: hypothetical protein VLH59_07205 [Ignavibacteriaceae bacterium]|nr:hypothetical protein [Ignavibacteriaceae bacterium]
MKRLIILFLFLILITAACSVLTLQPANFGWPIESVLPVDDEGKVTEDRYSIEINTVRLFFEEFQDSLSYKGKEVRMIRDNQGFYFMTASDFKNVYVFKADEGKLVQENKIFISEFGLKTPAFNQRDPYIELVDGTNKMNLTYKGVEGGSK